MSAVLAQARSRARCVIAVLAALAVGAGLVWTATPSAFAASTTPTTACPTPEVLTGMNALGATVATPGAPARTLDQSHATAFMQTFLAYSVFESPPQNYPPSNLPVSRVNVNVVGGGRTQPLLIFYATDGTRAWVGTPAAPPAPKNQKWIAAPNAADTIAAFEGRRTARCNAPETSASTAPGTPTTLELAEKPTGTSSANGTPWILGIVGVLIVAAGAVGASRLRRRRTA